MRQQPISDTLWLLDAQDAPVLTFIEMICKAFELPDPEIDREVAGAITLRLTNQSTGVIWNALHQHATCPMILEVQGNKTVIRTKLMERLHLEYSTPNSTKPPLRVAALLLPQGSAMNAASYAILEEGWAPSSFAYVVSPSDTIWLYKAVKGRFRVEKIGEKGLLLAGDGKQIAVPFDSLHHLRFTRTRLTNPYGL